jgi:non-homologous end joining protein Ku
MTSKAAFTEQEWDVVRSAPPAAGMIVITASRGGTVRETFEMAKVYADVRSEHGESELLDELVSSKPEVDRSGQHSLDELKQHALQRIGEAVELLERKATPGEVEDFRRFVTTLSERVARRHKEDGVEVSAAEQQAIDDVGTALGSPRA